MTICTNCQHCREKVAGLGEDNECWIWSEHPDFITGRRGWDIALCQIKNRGNCKDFQLKARTDHSKTKWLFGRRP